MTPAPRVPLSPEAYFHCEKFGGNYSGSFCVLRQTTSHTVAIANGQIKRRIVKRIPLHLSYCASGTCPQGTEILLQLGVTMKVASLTVPRYAKTCAACGEKFGKHHRESPGSFEQRKHCGPVCANKARARRHTA